MKKENIEEVKTICLEIQKLEKHLVDLTIFDEEKSTRFVDISRGMLRISLYPPILDCCFNYFINDYYSLVADRIKMLEANLEKL